MKKTGILRHKKHQIRIAKFVNRYMKWAQEVKDEELSISISDISEKSNEDEGSGNDSSSESSFLSYNSETIALENNPEDVIDEYYRHARVKLGMDKKDFVPNQRRQTTLRPRKTTITNPLALQLKLDTNKALFNT
jgi:hypothetical protein